MVDMVVQSTLTEIGQYTLRVLVEYKDHKAGTVPDSSDSGPYSPATPDRAPALEPKPRSLRKFYRFKVVAPVEINTVARVVNGSAFTQVPIPVRSPILSV